MTPVSKPNTAPLRTDSAWRWFPLGLTLSMAVVFAINAVLVWQALDSFPGKAVENDFDTSNNYNQVLDTAQAQAALGWNLQARTEAGHPVLVLADRDGKALEGAAITANAHRPLGPLETVSLQFVAEGNGIYRARNALPQAGNWDLLLHITANGHPFAATRRVTVK